MPDEPPSEPSVSSAPERFSGDETGPLAPDAPVRRSSRLAGWLIGLVVIVAVIVVAGFVIQLPYVTLSPGGTLAVQPRIKVAGAKTYPSHGPLLLLFVRERTGVNVWRWVQASLDPNTDILKKREITGGNSLQEVNEQDVCDMAQSQVAAKVAALTALGRPVSVLPGLVVAGLPSDLPAVKVLRPCDQIVAADGHVVRQPGDLARIIAAHPAGTSVALEIDRAGKTTTVHVPVVASGGRHIVGVSLGRRYKVPLSITIDTSNISGPSAGLAMALAIIDDLTPGDLTGGKRVAVTGTIAPDGSVGPIGGIAQKAVSARAAHAQIFIVPACPKNDPTTIACEKDLATARRRAGKDVVLAPVSSLAQALRVLHEAGGAPVSVASAA